MAIHFHREETNMLEKFKLISSNGTEYFNLYNWWIALLIGIVAGKFIFAKNTQRKVEEAEQQAQKIINDARQVPKT